MSSRSSWLPALGAFESAARHQNFAHAANELHLTASAVSHHVRKLEARIGVSLFLRMARGVELTPEGRMLADAAATALSDLDSVLEALREARRVARVRVSALPSFAACWLVPRLADFARTHPDIRVSIDTDRGLSRFDDGGPDIGLRYGPGRWTGVSSQFLLDETLFPAASPRLAGVSAITEPRQIATLPLLSDLFMQGWRDWFRAVGVRGLRLPDTHSFSDADDALNAAANGLGAVLARQRLVGLHLARGELIRLPGPAVAVRFGYYAVHPAHRTLTPAAEAFLLWLRRQAQEDAPASSATSATVPARKAKPMQESKTRRRKTKRA